MVFIRRNESCRVIVLAIGLIAIAVVSSVTAVWLINDANRLQRAYEQQAKTKAAHYTNRARVAEQRTCSNIPPKERLDCIKQERQTARQGRHDEYDLQAQLVTSVWTRYMGVAAIIGMAVGIFGLGLIFVTFREAKRTADESLEANKIAKQAQRPWLDFEIQKMEVPIFNFTEGIINLSADAIITNHANFPAHFVIAAARGYFSEYTMPPAHQKEAKEWVYAFLSRPNRKQIGIAVFPQKTERTQVDIQILNPENIADDKDPMANLVVGIRYFFDGGEGRTIKTFFLHRVRDHINWPPEGKEVLRDGDTVIRMMRPEIGISTSQETIAT